MQKKQIDLFFRLLDQELQTKGEVILIGASAGALMGHIRPSYDIDFEIRLKPRISPARLEPLILNVAARSSVAVNFSEDISHWSMISYLDYRRTAIFYKKFGKLTVKIVAPAYWTIGKMARYYALDARDVAAIIRTKKIKPGPLVKLWEKAYQSSDLCLEQGQFIRHAIHFLKSYGKRIWGRSFRPDFYIRKFSS